ncbi:MAG TPA: tetratricopeptide repeat protein [Pyrinomonadaceae bacterium]|jgi:tetratricopeptide (TPR) repeat protein
MADAAGVCYALAVVLRTKLIIAALCLVAGFAAGFLFANTANRRELDRLRAEAAGAGANVAGNKPATTTAGAPPAKTSLSDEELRAVVAKADANPTDNDLQRKVGEALYLYAVRFEKPDLLPEAARILKRAHDAAPKDYELLVALGNAEFDLARATDPAHFKAARTYYAQALAQKPDDINVRTDLGLTYYFDTPSEPRRAIAEYRKSLAQDPRHEMTLQNLVAALIAAGDLPEAEQRLAELQRVNADNPALNDLRAQLARARNAGGAR